MNHVERFRAVTTFQAVDRLPRWEWAMWWDQTIDRWHGEGLPRELRFSQVFDIARYFGLDPYQQFWFSTTDATIEATQHDVESIVSNMDDYPRIRPQLFPDHDSAIRGMSPWAARQERGEAVVWSTLEGFFWFPRTLVGFEKMMYAYADEPELLHQINQDLLEFNLRLLDHILPVCVPSVMTIAEDMSCNHGPMISKRTFDECVAPYYRQLLPRLQEHQIPLRQNDHEPWRARHARRIRAAPAHDAGRRVHTQRRSPNTSRRFARPIPVLSAAGRGIHRHDGLNRLAEIAAAFKATNS